MQEKLIWDGGENLFALKIKEFQALQQACDAGPEWVAQRLNGLHGGWRIEDIVDVLRIGLIGGGMEADKARALVVKTVNRVGPAALREVAFVVLMSEIQGPQDDKPKLPPGKRKASARKISQEPKSRSRKSSAPAPSSASRRNKSAA